MSGNQLPACAPSDRAGLVYLPRQDPCHPFAGEFAVNLSWVVLDNSPPALLFAPHASSLSPASAAPLRGNRWASICAMHGIVGADPCIHKLPSLEESVMVDGMAVAIMRNSIARERR